MAELAKLVYLVLGTLQSSFVDGDYQLYKSTHDNQQQSWIVRLESIIKFEYFQKGVSISLH